MLLSMLIAECLSKFRCTFLARLDAETYFFQLLECSIAYLLYAPCTYETASYNFCSLQVMHRIDLPSVILQLWLFLIAHTQWTRVPSIVLESVQEILNYHEKMMAAQLLSTFLYQFHSLEALKGHSMWVCYLYFVSRCVILTVFSLSMILVYR